MIVYALIDPRTDEIRYVGKTFRTAHRRLRRHLASSYLTGITHKERWIRALSRAGLEPRIEELQRCDTGEQLAAAEREHIARLRAAGARLTNATDGGDGGSGPHTAESREKIRRALTGKVRSADHRRRIGEAQKGRKLSTATRALISERHRGRPGRTPTDDERIRISRGRGSLPFVDQHGNVYQTQKGAARLLGLNVGHLNEVLHGTRKSVKGYVFRFVQEFPQ